MLFWKKSLLCLNMLLLHRGRKSLLLKPHYLQSVTLRCIYTFLSEKTTQKHYKLIISYSIPKADVIFPSFICLFVTSFPVSEVISRFVTHSFVLYIPPHPQAWLYSIFHLPHTSDKRLDPFFFYTSVIPCLFNLIIQCLVIIECNKKINYEVN